MKLPRFIASTPPPTQTGAVRADPRALTDTGDAQFRAIAGAGRALSNIAHMGLDSLIKRKRIDEDVRWGSGTTKTEEFSQGAVQTALDTDFTVDEPLPDSDDYLKAPQQLSVEKWDRLVGEAMTDYDKATSQIGQSFQSEAEKVRYENYRAGKRVEFQKDISKAYRDKLHAFETDRLQTLATTAYRNGDIEAGDSYIASMDKNELITPAKATSLKAAGVALAKGSAINDIKPSLIVAIESGTKQDGLDTLRVSVNQLMQDGVLTAVEGAEADKTLGDWLDSFVSGREKQAKDAVKLTTQETYADLSTSIVGGNLSYDDIEQSGLLKADQEKWQGYIKGSYKDSPTKSTNKGFTAAFLAVYDAHTLQLSPTQASDVLLEGRFNERDITDGRFEWGMDKIRNPYPDSMIEDIHSTVKSNNEDFAAFLGFFGDNKLDTKVNESFIAWVDDQIAKDKTPTRKEMYAMSSQFRVGSNRLVDIGQTMTISDRQYEVVGFDEDGEPLVEEVR